jgi:hypothetical protein
LDAVSRVPKVMGTRKRRVAPLLPAALLLLVPSSEGVWVSGWTLVNIAAKHSVAMDIAATQMRQKHSAGAGATQVAAR